MKKHKTTKAFTLAEGLIALLAIALLLTFVIGIIRGCAGLDTDMTDYLSRNYPGYEIINTECMSYDSDGDGYIRCTGSVRKDTNSDIQLVEAECNLFTKRCAPIKARGWR